jgi:hypothetical protein
VDKQLVPNLRSLIHCLVFYPRLVSFYSAIRVILHLSRSSSIDTSRKVETNIFTSLFSLQPASIYTGPLTQSASWAPGRHRLFFRAAVRRRSSRASVLAAGPGRKRAVWGGGEVEQGHRAGGAAGPGSARGRRRGLGGGGWIGARGKSRALLVEEDTAAVAGARGNGSRRNSWWGRCRRGLT